jgi:mannose-6-phosphate isomerase
MKLQRHYVEKPWGRTRLPPAFRGAPDGRIGEVWFVGDPSLELLTKYIFTSDRLSIQVHPDDEQARARGRSGGKSECWYILDADPGATIGLGLRREVSSEELRSSAVDGSIVELMDWRPVRAGDFLYVPAGTIHAIGGGIALVEFQQNSDASFRLYDYGRPRQLQLAEAVSVARRSSYVESRSRHIAGHQGIILVDGPQFTLAYSNSDTLQDRRRWIVPLEGTIRFKSDIAAPGDCLLAEAGERGESDGGWMLIAAAN